MARRRQTTGMPRKDRGQSDLPENSTFFDKLLGNPKNRAERDIAINNFIQRILGIIGALIVIIVAGFLIYEFLIVPQLTVATVNGERITAAEFRERVDFERAWVTQQYSLRVNQLQQQAAAFGMDVNQLAQQDQQLQQWGQELQFPDALGDRVLDQMIDDILIRQEFEALGLSLDNTAAEIARQDQFGYDPTEVAMIGTPATETPTPTASPVPLISPTPSPTPLPTSTPTLVPSPTQNPEATAEQTAEVTAEVTEIIVPTLPPSPTPSREDRLNQYTDAVDIFETSLRDSGTSQASIDAFWQREAIRNAVKEAVVGEITTTTYVNARHILVETEVEATEILAALNNGESFAALAQARSLDTGSGSRGGELGENPVGLYVGPFAEAVRTAEIGAIVGPIETDFGFHIIQVRERDERPVDDATVRNLTESQFSTWLTDRRAEIDAANGIEINENWPDLLN